jgi:hypothetical protein
VPTNSTHWAELALHKLEILIDFCPENFLHVKYVGICTYMVVYLWPGYI